MAAVDEFVDQRTTEILRRVDAYCDTTFQSARAYLDSFNDRKGVAREDVCYVVAGSFGRREAFQASDFDFIPIIRTEDTHGTLLSLNDELRDGLRDELHLDVSRGRDITRAAMLDEIIAPERIGGDEDNRTRLTQRILFLTESAQIGGGWDIRDVRRKIIDAYATERSAGRHPLAFCNDLARYYRTVCIDYKSRVDTRAADDWCTRNVKLRHSRKFWYFATLMGTVGITRHIHPDRTERFAEAILDVTALPPYLRLFESVDVSQAHTVGRIIDQYAWFLDFMGDSARRHGLTSVNFQDRYEPRGDNPYPALQWSAKLLHREMMALIDTVDRQVRDRVSEWFFL